MQESNKRFSIAPAGRRCLARTWKTWTWILIVAWSLSSPSGGLASSLQQVERVRSFLDDAEARLMQAWIESARASWIQSTYINNDTELMAAKAAEKSTGMAVELAQQAATFAAEGVDPEQSRKLNMLRLALTVPAPNNPSDTAELSRLQAKMESAYGKAKFCPDRGECWDLQEMGRIMAESRDAERLLMAWTGWRSLFPPMKADYLRYVELGNQGARELGFVDLGDMWRAKYDMAPDEFGAELDRLWDQVRPLYISLHGYVRNRLRRHYGADSVSVDGPIPAHLLGNMWAQQWGNIYDLVAPEDTDPGYDLSERLQEKKLSEIDMVRYGERFFMSLGFDPLPETFWERSLFVQPRDRDVVCHASAWSIDGQDDVRIKMCININAEDFATIHHELGHNFYQRAYKIQSPLFQDSANDGFHEAIGDTIALSVTPPYLRELGLIDEEPSADKDIGLLLQMALDKIAFLPFGLLVDQWRWKVFSGEIAEEDYNDSWWELREAYQGVAPPIARESSNFDPGAKYHVPASTPYSRYFLAHILQFQFHRALCKDAGYEGPLNRCTIYNSERAGAKLETMLKMGASRPWPDALEAVTGERKMDASAILDYFAPLKAWLDNQNEGVQLGW